jgi:hypothetical protein
MEDDRANEETHFTAMLGELRWRAFSPTIDEQQLLLSATAQLNMTALIKMKETLEVGGGQELRGESWRICQPSS